MAACHSVLQLIFYSVTALQSVPVIDLAHVGHQCYMMKIQGISILCFLNDFKRSQLLACRSRGQVSVLA